MKAALTSFRSRLRALFHRRRLEREMLEEMRLHVDALRDDFLRDGMTPEEARLAALKRFGGLAQLEERCRDEHGFAWVGQTWKDLRFTLRSLAQAKLYALAVMLSLVFGVSAATVAATFLYWNVEKRLGYPDTERLFFVGTGDNRQPSDWVRWGVDFAELQARHSAAADFVAAQRVPANLQTGRGPPQVIIHRLSPGCFEFFGIRPRLGRGLEPSDFEPGAPPVVVLGDIPWRQHFDQDPQVLGRTLRINGQDCRVIGVLTKGYPFPPFFAGDYYLPYLAPPNPAQPYDTQLVIAARLQRGISREQANALLAPAQPPGLDEAARFYFAAHRPVLVPLARTFNDGVSGAVLVGGAFLYLIACLNVVNLGLVRLLSRRREFAIRLSLGGSQPQVLRLVWLEHGTLAAGALALLLLLFHWGINQVFFAITADLNTLNSSFLNPFHLACLLAGIGFSILATVAVSHLRLRRVALGSALKEGDTPGGETRRMKRRRNALVVGQAALAVVLMTATGLMGLSIVRLLRTDFGYETADRLKVWLIFPPGHPSDPADRRAYFAKLWDVLATRPEIAGHSIGQDAMFPGVHRNTTPVQAADGSVLLAAGCSADAHLAESMGLRLRLGRWLSDRPGVRETVLTENLAHRLFPTGDPLGREVRLGVHGETPLTVVGVAQDIRDTLRQPPGLRIFLPLGMDPSRIETMILQLRGPMPPGFDYEVFRAIQAFDPQVLLANVSPMQELVQLAIGPELHVARMLFGFAGLGYLLALVALFATTAYTVESRIHEYGIRLALGTTPRALRLHILGRGAAPVLGGLGLGTFAAGGLAWFLRDMLYETGFFEPVVSVVVVLLLAAAGLLAGLRPALRAARADPAALLKSE